jgi:hypothetical protein
MRQALSKTSSFDAFDFELNKRLTDVIAEKHTENRSHGSFSSMVSTGCFILCSIADSSRVMYAWDFRLITSATDRKAWPTLWRPVEFVGAIGKNIRHSGHACCMEI